MPHITGTSLHFSLNVIKKSLGFFKKPYITSKMPQFHLKYILKASQFLKTLSLIKKKDSISLKMSSKRIEIFKKASNSMKISFKCHPFSKKSLAENFRIASVSLLPLFLQIDFELVHLLLVPGLVVRHCHRILIFLCFKV
jgi:hypothetical protein